MKSKILIIFILIIAIFSSCTTSKYVFLDKDVIGYKKPKSTDNIKRNIFPNSDNVTIPTNVVWPGLLREFAWNSNDSIGTFTVEYRYLIVVPYPITSSLMFLVHPSKHYLSKKDEGIFEAKAKMKRKLTDEEINDLISQKYAINFAGAINSIDNKNTIDAYYIEKIPIGPIIDVIVTKDEFGNVTIKMPGQENTN